MCDYFNLKNFLEGRTYYSTTPDEDFEPNDILMNTNLAIYCFKNNLYMDHCITRFIMVCPEESIYLYKRYKPFLRCNHVEFLQDICERYTKLDKNLYHLFAYYKLISTFDLDYFRIKYSEDDCIEYNIYKFCKERKLYTNYIERKKIVHIFDPENHKFLS